MTIFWIIIAGVFVAVVAERIAYLSGKVETLQAENKYMRSAVKELNQEINKLYDILKSMEK